MGYPIEDVGLTPDETEQAWGLYEKTGNIAEVARQLRASYYHVRAALNRDPIRLHEIRQARLDDTHARWEGQEVKATKLTHDIMDIVDGIVRHIHACVAQGENLTDLVSNRAMPFVDEDGHVVLGQDGFPLMPRMTPTQAMQWLVESRILDSIGRVSANANKAVVGLKMVEQVEKERKGDTIDPTKMSDAELLALVDDLKASGRELPPAVQEWLKQKLARRLA